MKAAKAAAYPVYHLLIFFLRSKIFLPILVFHTTIDNIFFEKNNFCTKNGNTQRQPQPFVAGTNPVVLRHQCFMEV